MRVEAASVCVAGAAAVVALVTALPAGATALSAFHTPAWAVQCYVVGEEAPPVLICSQPRDGSYVSMSGSGRVQRGVDARDKNYRDPFAARRLLGFDRYWKFRSRFGCASRARGLICRNRAGHGWDIRRRGTVTIY
jgi:hypothetical protein